MAQRYDKNCVHTIGISRGEAISFLYTGSLMLHEAFTFMEGYAVPNGIRRGTYASRALVVVHLRGGLQLFLE